MLPSPAPPPPPEPVNPDIDVGPAVSDVLEYRRLLMEQARRQIEALRLYEPLPLQTDFHSCKARNRLLRGSNRSGKTLSAAVELARAVTGRDPVGKYPERDGRAYVVGKDEKHLGEVIYRKLFRAGAFKIIRDIETGVWRSYRPWSTADRMRKKEAKPAPPLIPERYIKARTWKSKGDNIPEKITLTTGWEIDFWSSLSKPPRGSDLDLVWFDEEIVDSEWYPEMSARLLDRAGVLFWGATPQTGTDRLYELHCRCEEQFELWQQEGFKPDEEPSSREFLILLKDNPHIEEQQKVELEKDLTEDEIEVRIGGGFAIEASKVYPEWNPRVYDIPYIDIPNTWTRYAFIDPGRQVCAVLFAAVPHPEESFVVGEGPDGRDIVLAVGQDKYVLLYDELYIRNCDAAKFGERMAAKTAQQEFEAFVIDRHGSRISDIGSGRSVEEQYSAALEANGVKSNRTGHGFLWGSDDVDGGIESVRTYMRIRPNGRPTLITVAVKDKLPNFKWEIERYRYKKTKEGAIDKPEDRGRVHQMANVRYCAVFDPVWVQPRGRARDGNTPYAAFKRKQARRRQADGNGSINLGPSRGKP